MISREYFSDKSCRLSQGESRSQFVVPKPGVIYIQSSGPGDPELDSEVMAALSREIERSGRLKVFADLSQATRMAPQTREHAVVWGREHRAQLDAAHLLCRSKLVEMALSVIGMFLGGGLLKLYSERRDFLAALHTELPGFNGSFSDLRSTSMPRATP